MADHSLLYSIQNDIFVAIKKIHRNLKTEKACNKTQNYFERHEHDLEALWRDFVVNHEKLKSGGINKRDLYFKSNMFGVAEGLYKTTRDKLHQMHQYYKLTKFPGETQGSSQKHDTQEADVSQQKQDKQEIEESIDLENSEMDTDMNPVNLLENSDVTTISDCAVMNTEDPNSGVEFISVELLLNELSSQTASASKTEEVEEFICFKRQKSTNGQSNIDLSFLEQFDEHPGRKVRCPVNDCATHLASKDRMIRHIRVHNGEMPYQCNNCDYATYNSTRFAEHINTHAGIKPYKCNYCNYSSVSKKYLKQHQDKHCKCDCGYISKNRNSLEAHQKDNCPLEHKKRPYTCKHCTRGFSTRVALTAHKQERGMCSICDITVCVLKAHTKKFHSETFGDKLKNYKFTCKVCGWKGGREPRVLLHLIHHPQEVGKDIDVTILKKYNIL